MMRVIVYSIVGVCFFGLSDELLAIPFGEQLDE